MKNSQSTLLKLASWCYKGKGTANNPARYRCNALLNHLYKILSRRILLKHLISNSENFLNDWQASLCPGRGCRDNITILRTLCEHFMQLGKWLAVTFIDYAAAFDSLSHKWGPTSTGYLQNQISQIKREQACTRPNQPSKRLKTQMVSKQRAKSEVFPIRRGVLQGDIIPAVLYNDIWAHPENSW